MMQRKKILILGSGLISEPLIDYLMKRSENKITIGSNNPDELKNILEKKKGSENFTNLRTTYIDVVSQKSELEGLISKNDIVVGLVPGFLIIYIAQACVEVGRNLITTSYISDSIKSLEKSIIAKKLTFIFENGINPGIDHIVAYKVIREQHKQGNVIIGYQSWVGAVPSPDYVDNPLMYKFSWDPKGALLVLKNEARQLINGKIVNITEKNLFTTYLVDKRFHPSLNLEGYYNRDSIKYKDLYELKHAKSVVRGIIRYQGFSFIIQCFKYLNLFSFDKIDENAKNWRDHLNKVLRNPRIQDTIYDIKDKYIKRGQEMFIYNINTSDHVAERMFYFNLSLLALSFFDDKYIRKYSFEVLFNRIYSTLIYLDFYNENNVVTCI
jgi:saccharopine dehydrogenase-like NADP-dependent oxidoreductase